MIPGISGLRTCEEIRKQPYVPENEMAAYVAPAIYNILVTFISGVVFMIIFFFVFEIISPEGEK